MEYEAGGGENVNINTSHGSRNVQHMCKRGQIPDGVAAASSPLLTKFVALHKQGVKANQGCYLHVHCARYGLR